MLLARELIISALCIGSDPFRSCKILFESVWHKNNDWFTGRNRKFSLEWYSIPLKRRPLSVLFSLPLFFFHSLVLIRPSVRLSRLFHFNKTPPLHEFQKLSRFIFSYIKRINGYTCTHLHPCDTISSFTCSTHDVKAWKYVAGVDSCTYIWKVIDARLLWNKNETYLTY